MESNPLRNYLTHELLLSHIVLYLSEVSIHILRTLFILEVPKLFIKITPMYCYYVDLLVCLFLRSMTVLTKLDLIVDPMTSLPSTFLG